MISKQTLQAEPLFVSLRGQWKEDGSWVSFDHYEYSDEKLFLIGLTLDHVERKIPIEELDFSADRLEYTSTFLEKKLNGMKNALEAIKKIENEKGQSL